MAKKHVDGISRELLDELIAKRELSTNPGGTPTHANEFPEFLGR